MKRAPLSNGYVALVDNRDFKLVSRFRWHGRKSLNRPSARRYAQANVKINGRWTTIQMHRLITGWSMKVDHRNGDGLDNRRKNLRPATNSANSGNRIKDATAKTSRYKGVSWSSREGRWQAYIWITSCPKHYNKFLGYFDIESDAARAYDAAARAKFGGFSCVNFPKAGERWALEDPLKGPRGQGKP